MIPVSVKAILRGPDGTLFLQNPRNELELPGGRPDSGESLESTLIREVQEECGIAIRSAEYLGSESYEVIPGKHVLLVFFSCAAFGEPIVLSDEHTDYTWINTSGKQPHNMPDFYWDICKKFSDKRHIFSECVGNTPAVYPLLTGEADKQRLKITADIYNTATTNFLRKHLPKTGHMLEVGCGHGQIAQWLASNSPKTSVIGLDNNPEQLEIAKSSALAHGISNVSFEIGDLNDLSSLSKQALTFELIFCRFTLLHIARRSPVIEMLLSLLTASGTLVIEEPSLNSLFCLPPVAGFEQANAAISAYGKSNGINYDCIEDLWSIITQLDVHIKQARFSQPTVWDVEQKRLVSMSFHQMSDRLVAQGILEKDRVTSIKHSLDNEYMNTSVISGGLRTLQIAISVKGTP